MIPYFCPAGKSGKPADFCSAGFGAKDIGRMPFPDKPGFMHVEVEINGGALGSPMPNGHAIAAGCSALARLERRTRFRG